MTRRFTHDQTGTGEPEWFGDPVWDEVPAAEPAALLEGMERLVVLSAHPDDESIGAGATIAALSGTVATVLVLATAGEHSHPRSEVWDGEQLARVRRDEWRRAAALLAPQAELVELGLADGDLAAHEDALVAALEALCGPRTLVLAPCRQDGHPDHEAAGRAAAEAVSRRGGRLLEYPVWWWHWNRPGASRALLAGSALVCEPGPEAVRRKHAALDEYGSQLDGLGPGPEHGPVVSEPIRVRSRRAFEVLFAEHRPEPARPSSPDAFDEMYDRGDDPWGWEESWYERRRRGLVTAVLQQPRHRHVLELGCGTGLLTVDLASRADRVTATDISARALDVARRRELPNVTWQQAALPEQVPEGTFDLVVLSEVAYFLRPTQVLALLRRVRERLADDGLLVLANWAHPTRDIPLDGPLVHELVDVTLGLPRVAAYRDDDVLVEAWGRLGSAARREGLV